MDKKYWVPAIERANEIIRLLAAEPSKLRLVDLSKRLNINKSSMFSLLNTMETLGWAVKEKGDTYVLGPAIGLWSASYFRQYSILQWFYQEAPISMARMKLPIQLSILEGSDIVYLAKEESDSPFRLATDPGMRFPAYATAMGKVLLSIYSRQDIDELYPDRNLSQKTPFTLKHTDELWTDLEWVRSEGYAVDNQEAMIGFCCIATPVLNYEGKVIAAVSMTMLSNEWEEKHSLVLSEIRDLSKRLSKNGDSPEIN